MEPELQSLALSSDQKSIKYTVEVKNMDNVTMAHIHQDKRGENDPVVVVLYKATASYRTKAWNIASR